MKTIETFFGGKPHTQQNQGPQGLQVIENFISPEEEKQLTQDILQSPWNDALKRRTQHYGYKYSYRNRSISKDDYLGPLPDWSDFVEQRMQDKKLIAKKPNQLIVNEYLPGQGIAAHTDAKVFGDPVISLSLGSSCAFVFSRGSKQHVLQLNPRTLVIMSGESRNDWKHQIPARKADRYEGVMGEIKRTTRWSMTYRFVE